MVVICPYFVPLILHSPEMIQILKLSTDNLGIMLAHTILQPFLGGGYTLAIQDLNEASENCRLLFFNLSQSLPVVKRSATAKGIEKEGTSAATDQRVSMAPVMQGRGSSLTAVSSQRNYSLKELPAGQMGKLLVYKSGAVKLKLGDTLFDVSPGSDCSCAQEVVAVNIKENECCSVGELHKAAVVTPDIDNILSSVDDLKMEEPFCALMHSERYRKSVRVTFLPTRSLKLLW